MRESGNEESMPYIDCLAKFRSSTKNKAAVFKMANADDLRRGMVLEQDVTDINGLLLMTSGQLVTDTVIHRLSVFANRDSLNQPFRVRVAA